MAKTFKVFFVYLIVLASPTSATERTIFYGTWGTEKQCARKPIKPGGTVLSAPFELNEHWLRQGGQWCRLNWGPIEKRARGFFTAANAQCGEDNVQGYFLGIELKNGDLTLFWNFWQSNGPLMRCVDD